MDSLHPRPIYVLALGLLLLVPFAVFGFSGERWAEAESAFRHVEGLVTDLITHPDRRIARAAQKSGPCVEMAGDCGHAADSEGYFKNAQNAAKRLEKLVKAAGKAGADTTRIEAALLRVRISARSIVFEGIREVKARPDFEIDDRVVRAAAKAEMLIEKARRAETGRKPWLRAMKAYRKAFLRLEEFL
jgi:hypothetical protein